MKVNPDEKGLLDQNLPISNTKEGQRDHNDSIELNSLRGGSTGSLTGSVRRLGQSKQTNELKIKNKIKDVVEGKYVIITMSLVTIFALFGDDLRNWLTNKEADIYFDSCLVISMIVFTFEILINTIVVDEFKYSFFFWLDIIATMSLIMDIDWILDFFKIYIAGATPSF
jgi:hypothetical protein